LKPFLILRILLGFKGKSIESELIQYQLKPFLILRILLGLKGISIESRLISIEPLPNLENSSRFKRKIN